MSRLRSAIGPRQTVCGRLWHLRMDHLRFVAFAEHERVAANPLALWIVIKEIDHCVECARQIYVVAVDERENVARSAFETFIDRVHLATIFFTHPVSELVFVTANDGNTLVGAAAIDDDVLERFMPLVQYRQSRLFQV